MGECLIKVEIPELSMVINYDFIMDDIEENMLVNASLLYYAQIQLMTHRS